MKSRVAACICAKLSGGVTLAAVGLLSAVADGSEPVLTWAEEQPRSESAGAPNSGAGDRTLPAWQEPGFVMDEILVTGESIEPLIVMPEPARPDLEMLLKLHRQARLLAR